MTNAELLDAAGGAQSLHIPVRVTASDYRYDGWLIMVGCKRSGALRCVVEDSNGRLFIHNAGQLATRKGNHK